MGSKEYWDGLMKRFAEMSDEDFLKFIDESDDIMPFAVCGDKEGNQ